MKYTNEQIRGAILRAADKVQHSGLYKYSPVEVGECGTPMCMWGWIGFELGFEPGCLISPVASAIGCTKQDLYSCCHYEAILRNDANAAADGMRVFAARFFPDVASPIVAEDRQLVAWSACPWQPSQVRA